MAKEFTLGKTERLKSRKQIEQLFKEGKRFALTPFRIFYVINDGPDIAGKPSLLFGVGVGTRTFKKAVDRNRVKRLIREAWRLQKIELETRLTKQRRQLNVFFIYTGKELPLFKEVQEGINKSLGKLTKIIS